MPTISSEKIPASGKSSEAESPRPSQSPAGLLSRSAENIAQSLPSQALPQLHSPDASKAKEMIGWLNDSDVDDSDDEAIPADIRDLNYANTLAQGSNLVADNADNGADFQSLLAELGGLRHALATDNGEDDVENFGAPRNGANKIGRQEHWETTIVRENYPQHLAAVARFLNDKDTQLAGGWNDGNKTYTHQISTSQGKHIPATTIHVQTANLGKPEIECTLEHTPCAHLPVLNEEASTLFNETVEHAKNGNSPEAISSLAKFVYVFAHAMPLKRGSAMVGEIFTHGLLQKTGQTREFEQLKGLDFLAFTTKQHVFEGAFRTKLGF